jgi:hypothetical protein
MAISSFPRRDDGRDPIDVYNSVRAKIRTGDLLLCSGIHPFSYLIRGATSSDWSHVGFVVRFDDMDRVMVFESVESFGVRAITLRRYLKDYHDDRAYEGGVVLARHSGFPKLSNGELYRRFGSFSVDKFGYRYDRDQIVKIAGRLVSRFFGDEQASQFDGDKEYICSEYVHICYQRMGLRIRPGPHGFVAPSDFAANRRVKNYATLKNPG